MHSGSIISNKRPSYLPKVNQVPDGARQRIPDNDHLAKMRVYLMNAHKNDNFIQNLDGDGLIPTALRQRLEQRKETEAELGESFMELMIKGQNNNKIRDFIETGVEDSIEEDTEEYAELQKTGITHGTNQKKSKNQKVKKPHP